MYKLFLDKQENFRCSIKITGSTLSRAVVRLAVETENYNLYFKGSIVNGEAVIPIKPLRGILDVGNRGTIRLEVIVDDTYITPWESEFEAVKNVSIQASVSDTQQLVNAPTPKIDVSNIKIANLFKK